MCEYRVWVGVDLINELLRESGEGEGGGTACLTRSGEYYVSTRLTKPDQDGVYNVPSRFTKPDQDGEIVQYFLRQRINSRF